MKFHNQDGEAITSVEEWFKNAPPVRGQIQWQDGQSAKELAKAWCIGCGGPVVPEAVAALLRSSPALKDCRIEEGTPERVVTLDDVKGGQRNADIVLIGQAGASRVVISVEAKADEAFGSSDLKLGTVENEFRHKDATAGKRKRILQLCRTLCHLKKADDLDDVPTPVLGLRYQLVYSAVGAMNVALEYKASIAVFLIHDLLPRDPKHQFMRSNGSLIQLKWNQVLKNREEYAVFVRTLLEGTEQPVPPSFDYGIAVDCGTWSVAPVLGAQGNTHEVRLFCAKVLSYTA